VLIQGYQKVSVHLMITIQKVTSNVRVLIENQQMHQNNHIIVMLTQTLLHVLAYQRHYQGAHMILTSYSYLYAGVYYKKNL
jgi:hypothetical protein